MSSHGVINRLNHGFIYALGWWGASNNVGAALGHGVFFFVGLVVLDAIFGE